MLLDGGFRRSQGVEGKKEAICMISTILFKTTYNIHIKICHPMQYPANSYRFLAATTLSEFQLCQHTVYI